MRSATELYHRRVEMRKSLDALPKLEAEQRDVRKQIEKADTALAEAEAKHEGTTNPLRWRLKALAQEIGDAERCRRELVAGCTDAALVAEIAALADKLRQARERQRVANEALSRQRSYEVGGNEAVVFEGTREQMENARRAHVAGAWAWELAEAEKLIAALEKREAALHERMLVL